MNMIWKGAAALIVAGSALTAVSAPAQAQYYRGDYRGGWDGDRGGRGDHGWRGDRSDWRGDRGDWRRDRHWRRDHNRHGWRDNYRRCWTEWRRGYHGQRVKVRICR